MTRPPRGLGPRSVTGCADSAGLLEPHSTAFLCLVRGSGKGALGPLPSSPEQIRICSQEIMYRAILHPFPRTQMEVQTWAFDCRSSDSWEQRCPDSPHRATLNPLLMPSP